MYGSIRFVVILLTISWLSYTFAFIVCSPNFCSIVDCSNMLSEKDCIKQNKEYRPNSTICGCCSTCVDYIPVGGNCSLCSTLPIIRGPPIILRHCAPGSSCIRNRCVSDHSESKEEDYDDTEIKCFE